MPSLILLFLHRGSSHPGGEQAAFLVDFSERSLRMEASRNPGRTNTFGWLFKSVVRTNASLAALLSGIDKRINQITHIWDASVQEPMQIVRYAPTQGNGS
jgi:hypothetical protein